ncbi:MAG: hypothetical protein ACLFO1_03425 [Spirochaetaceae bacterium]
MESRSCIARITLLPVALLLLITGLAVGQESAAPEDQPGQEPGAEERSAQSEEQSREHEPTLDPFVSGLRVATRDPRVRLTWREVHDDVALHHIYRATVEITEDTFDQAVRIGTVSAETETFVDVPPEAGTYYYAVLSETADDTVHEVFLPFRNKTTQPVRIRSVADRVELSAEVISLDVERRGDEILLRFRSNRPGRNLAVFRSTQPLTSLDDLAIATRIDIVGSDRRSYTDFPVPGIEYYYGVFDTQEVADGEIAFEQGRNVSQEAVALPLEAATLSRSLPEDQLPRRRPLPFLMIDETLRDGTALVSSPLRLTPDRRPLSEETVAAIEAVLGPAPSRVQADPPDPVVLPEERLTDTKGPRFTLKSIAEGPFAAGRWEETIDLLENMLTISLAEDVEARVHFYLGQARYFAGERRRAFLDFVLARDAYFLETKPWIDRVILELHSSPG